MLAETHVVEQMLELVMRFGWMLLVGMGVLVLIGIVLILAGGSIRSRQHGDAKPGEDPGGSADSGNVE